MFFEKLSKEEKLEYIKNVVLGEDYNTAKISDIFYQLSEAEEDFPQCAFLSFSVLDPYSEEENFVEKEVFDFEHDQVHSNFMAQKFGVEYLNAMQQYAKENNDNSLLSMAKNSTEYYVKHLNPAQSTLEKFTEDTPVVAQTVTLDDFMDKAE